MTTPEDDFTILGTDEGRALVLAEVKTNAMGPEIRPGDEILIHTGAGYIGSMRQWAFAAFITPHGYKIGRLTTLPAYDRECKKVVHVCSLNRTRGSAKADFETIQVLPSDFLGQIIELRYSLEAGKTREIPDGSTVTVMP